MRGAGFDARLSDAIRREMWEKWIFLASVGAITCLMRGTIGEVEASPGGVPFVLHLLDHWRPSATRHRVRSQHAAAGNRLHASCALSEQDPPTAISGWPAGMVSARSSLTTCFAGRNLSICSKSEWRETRDEQLLRQIADRLLN
jgi:hypothetical protein